MSEEEVQPPYVLKVSATGKTQARSRDFSGHGTAQYPMIEEQPRESYTGDFRDGVRAGRGVYEYASGARYKGGWEENRKSGLGRARYVEKIEAEDGTVRSQISEYHGNFHDGLKHGPGSFRYASGDIFSGNWASGKKHGQGTYFFAADGSTLEGTWKSGEIISGAWSLSSGLVWAGDFALGQPCGLGTWKFPNGQSCQGEFVQAVDVEDLDPNEDGSLNQRRTLKSVDHLTL